MVPDGIDDPARPSGGNAYDRRICAGLDVARLVGAANDPHPARGPGRTPRREPALARLLAAIPDGAVVLSTA